jgi:hypothetical protein
MKWRREMTMTSAISSGCEARVEQLRTEFGATFAARIIEAEAADFLWGARLRQRYLGQHFDIGFAAEDDETELSRIAVLSLLDGVWHVAACLVDGEGQPVDLLWKQRFGARQEAEPAFERAA